MRITATFLDEISFDIPHHNWGRDEWDRDFAAMKAMGIRQKVNLAGDFAVLSVKLARRLREIDGCGEDKQ